MVMSKKCNLTNHLLVAMPSLQNPFFYQSVIYVGKHTDDGILGVAINKTTDLKLDRVFEQLEIKATHARETPIYVGGPLNTELGLILYQNKGNNELLTLPSTL